MPVWDTKSNKRARRLRTTHKFANGKIVDPERLIDFLQVVIVSGDRACLEGDNQKQADVLARALARVDVGTVRDLHMERSGVVLPEHLDLFESGIARKLSRGMHACNRAWRPGAPSFWNWGREMPWRPWSDAWTTMFKRVAWTTLPPSKGFGSGCALKRSVKASTCASHDEAYHMGAGVPL